MRIDNAPLFRGLAARDALWQSWNWSRRRAAVAFVNGVAQP